MAEKLNQETAEKEADQFKNAKDILAGILFGMQQVHRKEEEIEAAKAKHIQPLQEDLREIRTALKARTGIAWDDMKPLYDVYDRLKAIGAFEDSEERDKSRDHLLLIFEALFGKVVKDQQLDLFAMEKAVDKAKDPGLHLTTGT